MLYKRTGISVIALLLAMSFLFSCAPGKSGNTTDTRDADRAENPDITTSFPAETTEPEPIETTGQKGGSNTPSTDGKENKKVVHPSAAPAEIPDAIQNLTDFSPITGHDHYPTAYSGTAKAYLEGYTGEYDNAGRIHMDGSNFRIKRVMLLMSRLSITIDSGSAFYISSNDLDVNVFIEGQNTLSSKNSVTLNNNSGMDESTMDFNGCSTLRIMGTSGKNADTLSLVSDYSRSSVGGRVVVNNCTLDLSKGVLTSYAQICVERGGKVIFPDRSTVSLSESLDPGVYFACDYEKRMITVYCVDEDKQLDIDIAYSTGENLTLSGKSGEVTLKMPAPGISLSMDNDFCSITCKIGGTEIAPLSVGGENVFYLPKGTNLTDLSLTVYLGAGYSVTVGKKKYTESGGIKAAAGNGYLSVEFTDPGGNVNAQTYRFICSSANVLYLQIDESKGSISEMNRDKAHNTYCYGSLSFAAENSDYSFASYFSIKGRGNATWDDEKKGYALKMYKSDVFDEKDKIDICGMGSSANWTLIANHRDRTLIRNALAYTLARELGMAHAVNYVFVDLYMNGEYLGLYMLVEKIENGEGKVDIKEAKEDNLDGGYFLEFDNYDDTPQVWLPDSRQRVTIKSPDDLAGYNAIEALLNEADAAIQSENGYNRATRKYWYDYIDINSFAILWMVREYTMDYDATVNFRFYYDPSDGKFHGGPVWDFDNSMARTAGVYADPERAIIESGDRNNRCWLTQLMKFSEFRAEIVRLYDAHIDLFTNDSSTSIYALAYRYRNELEASITHNFERWSSQLANTSWNTPEDRSYEGHFGILTDFIYKRNNFWRKYIPSLTR